MDKSAQNLAKELGETIAKWLIYILINKKIEADLLGDKIEEKENSSRRRKR